MKKHIFTILLSLILLPAFSEQYKITSAEYTTEGNGFKFLGKSNVSIVQQQFPLDKKRIFESREALEKYLKNYEKTLSSSRHFETIDISYETDLSTNEDIYNVILKINLKDSHHLLVMPYPKYSTDDGISLKLKAKDSNFLGSLNTMNIEALIKKDDDGFKPGFAFDFDFPFFIGNVKAIFINDYELSYVVGNDYDMKGFEWKTKTGLSLSVPFEKLPLNIGLYQYTAGDFKYKYSENKPESYIFKNNEDFWYFSEEVSVGTEVKFHEFPNYTKISYVPSVSLKWHWDHDGINIANDDLSSPIVTFSHSLSNEKITWNDNMRKGYSLSLANSISYNFHRHDINPSISFDGKLFWNYQANEQEYWNRYGICSKLHAFYYFEVPYNKYKKQYTEDFHENLRGFCKSQKVEYPGGFVLNIDLPHNVFTSNFDKDILNFNLQFSPFLDIALCFDRNSSKSFNFIDDGYYCAGFEVLVYPLKWSSFTIRASLGIYLNNAVHEANFLEAISDNKELFIGIGLHY